jgi:hypothetical protein
MKTQERPPLPFLKGAAKTLSAIVGVEHGGLAGLITGVAGESVGEMMLTRLADRFLIDAMGEPAAAVQVAKSFKTGNTAGVAAALSKDPTWAARMKTFIHDTLIKGTRGEAGAPGTVSEGGSGSTADTIKAGGGTFKGIQEGVPEAGLKSLALFDHPETGSTLALPEDGLTPEAVRDRLASHKTDWDAKQSFSKEEVGGMKGLGLTDEEIAQLQKTKPLKRSAPKVGEGVGGHAGGGVVSAEELARGNRHWSVKKSGPPTYHGSQYDPGATEEDGAHFTELPDGTLQTNAGTSTPEMEARVKAAMAARDHLKISAKPTHKFNPRTGKINQVEEEK